MIFFYLFVFIEETPCARVRCRAYSECVVSSEGHTECRCLPGYREVGNVCQPFSLSSAAVDCRQEDKCDINAQCTYDSRNDRYHCQCLSGFRGDGYNCTQASGETNIVFPQLEEKHSFKFVI